MLNFQNLLIFCVLFVAVSIQLSNAGGKSSKKKRPSDHGSSSYQEIQPTPEQELEFIRFRGYMSYAFQHRITIEFARRRAFEVARNIDQWDNLPIEFKLIAVSNYDKFFEKYHISEESLPHEEKVKYFLQAVNQMCSDDIKNYEEIERQRRNKAFIDSICYAKVEQLCENYGCGYLDDSGVFDKIISSDLSNPAYVFYTLVVDRCATNEKQKAEIALEVLDNWYKRKENPEKFWTLYKDMDFIDNVKALRSVRFGGFYLELIQKSHEFSMLEGINRYDKSFLAKFSDEKLRRYKLNQSNESKREADCHEPLFPGGRFTPEQTD